MTPDDDDLDFARETLGPSAAEDEVQNLANLRADRDERDVRAAVVAQVATTILEEGHAIICSTDESGEHPFAYTIGRTTVGRPELIVSGGLDPRLASQILNKAAAQDDYLADVRAGASLTNIIEGYAIEVADADPEAAPINMARMFYGDQHEIRLLQLLLPDSAGRFPGEPGFSMQSQQTWPITSL